MRVRLALDQFFFVSAANCKEKWRNLRTVFIRKQKPPPSGSGKKASKQYYLNDVMQFIVPFVKIQNSEEIPGNVPSPPSPDFSSQHDSEISDAEENTESEVSHELVHTAPVNPKETSSHVVHAPRIPSSSRNNTSKKLKTKPDLDSTFMNYFQTKKKKEEEPTSARKHFLLSVLPDVENLSSSQFSVFRRQLLDNIDYARSYQESPRTDTPSSVLSLTYTTSSAGPAASPNDPQQPSFPSHYQSVSQTGSQDPSPASSNVQSPLGSPTYTTLSSRPATFQNYPTPFTPPSFPPNYASHASQSGGQKPHASTSDQYCNEDLLIFNN